MTIFVLVFQVEISPLLNAVETVESKNKELDRIITNLSSDRTQSINPLSMILNGIIDAAVMGGIAKYEEVRTHLPSLPPMNLISVINSVMGVVDNFEGPRTDPPTLPPPPPPNKADQRA